MMVYKNVGCIEKTFYGVTFKPGETHEVNGFINHKDFISVQSKKSAPKPEPEQKPAQTNQQKSQNKEEPKQPVKKDTPKEAKQDSKPSESKESK